ncbi:hypothetical protein H4582DRAFT_2054147 [Lactarius indigo]|nr:hypothetical protein H4582DRAFT_2054147 [Lactarius indigo]
MSPLFPHATPHGVTLTLCLVALVGAFDAPPFRPGSNLGAPLSAMHFLLVGWLRMVVWLPKLYTMEVFAVLPHSHLQDPSFHIRTPHSSPFRKSQKEILGPPPSLQLAAPTIGRWRGIVHVTVGGPAAFASDLDVPSGYLNGSVRFPDLPFLVSAIFFTTLFVRRLSPVASTHCLVALVEGCSLLDTHLSPGLCRGPSRACLTPFMEVSRSKASATLYLPFCRRRGATIKLLRPAAVYEWALSVDYFRHSVQCALRLARIAIKTLATAIASRTPDPQVSPRRFGEHALCSMRPNSADVRRDSPVTVTMTTRCRDSRPELDYCITHFVHFKMYASGLADAAFKAHAGKFWAMVIHRRTPPNVPANPPYIDIKAAFFLPKAFPPEVFDTLIHVAGHKILITGYLDNRLGPNPNLQHDFPLIPWKGEIAVLFIGKRRPYISRAPPKSLIRFAIVQYMQACIAHVEIGSPFPSYMKSIWPGLGVSHGYVQNRGQYAHGSQAVQNV